MDSQWSKQDVILHVRFRYGSLSITTPVSFLANRFDVRSILHVQVSLAAVDQICYSLGFVRLQKSSDSLKACFENVNIRQMIHVNTILYLSSM